MNNVEGLEATINELRHVNSILARDLAEEREKAASMSAREHLAAAWEAAYQVPEGRKIPGNMECVSYDYSTHRVSMSGAQNYPRVSRDGIVEYRTLDPLPEPPSELANVRYIWADDTYGRSLWFRPQISADEWESTCSSNVVTSVEMAALNPVPVKGEDE